MLLDPLVASKLGGFSHRAKAEDLAAFALAWEAGAPSPGR